MGLNEFAGYIALAASALATGWIGATYGFRPQPFYLGVGFVVTGLVLSLLVRETHGHALTEGGLEASRVESPALAPREVFQDVTWRNTTLSSVSLTGLVNNLNDGMVWGLFPLAFAAAGLDLARIGLLAAVYPATWGIGQLATGAISDRLGRKPLIVWGMWIQAVGIGAAAIAHGFAVFLLGALLLGIGTAMAYPSLLAAIGDVVHPSSRGTAVGVYRFWRDLGYAVGALLAGVTADALGLSFALWLVAVLTFFSGLHAAVRMEETLARNRSFARLDDRAERATA